MQRTQQRNIVTYVASVEVACQSCTRHTSAKRIYVYGTIDDGSLREVSSGVWVRSGRESLGRGVCLACITAGTNSTRNYKRAFYVSQHTWHHSSSKLSTKARARKKCVDNDGDEDDDDDDTSGHVGYSHGSVFRRARFPNAITDRTATFDWRSICISRGKLIRDNERRDAENARQSPKNGNRFSKNGVNESHFLGGGGAFTEKKNQR